MRGKQMGHFALVHEIRKLSQEDHLGNIYNTDNALFAEFVRRHGKVDRERFDRALLEVRKE